MMMMRQYSAGIIAAAIMGFASVPAHAQEALRAPLNIIPFAMQDAIGAKADSGQSREKLAPRIAARQSKRAVRAVTAAPGTEGGLVQVGSLGTLQDAPVGLEAGFGDALWRGARLAFIADQMARLPVPVRSAGLRDIELTLHRGATAAPIGTVDGTSWYAARLNRFLALGDTASVLALEELTGAARSDAYAAEALAKAHLGRGDAPAACAVTRPTKRTGGYGDTLEFFMRLLVYCQLRNGEFEKASLALELNERTLGADKLFRDIAYLMAAQVTPVFGTAQQADAAREGGETPPLVLPNELKPLQIALLQLAGQPLPPTLNHVPPFMAASLARDYGQLPLVQLQAALDTVLATRRQSLPSDIFSQVAQLADLSAWPDPYAAVSGAVPPAAENSSQPDSSQSEGQISAEAETQTDALDALSALPAPVFLAYSLRRIDMAEADAQPRIMADVLRQALELGLWAEATRLLHDRLTDLGLVIDPPAGQDSIAPSAVQQSSEPDTFAAGDAPQIGAADKAVLLPALAYLGLRSAADSLTTTSVLDETAQRMLTFGQTMRADDIISDTARDMPGGTDASGDVPLDDLLAALAKSDLAQSADGPNDLGDKNAVASANPQIENTSYAGGFDEAADSDTRPHPIADLTAYEARMAAAGPALQKFMRRELAIYQGLGFDLPTGLALPTLKPVPPVDTSDEADEGATPETPPVSAQDIAQKRLEKLIAAQWTGDLLLALIADYGVKAPAQMSDREVMQLLSALHRVGLHQAAEQLGSAFLARSAAQLSVAAPDALVVTP